MSVILIVEDEPFTRELAGICIDEWGHSPLFADSVDAALTILQSRREIDAMFTDIHLNDAVRGGCDLGHAAIALHPNLRVLYTSGNEASDELRSHFVSGAHFLRKPYTLEQLYSGVNALLVA